MDPDVLRAPGTMEADASVLADVLPTESLSASGRPLGPLREELYRIPDIENVGHVVGVWVQSLGVLLLAAGSRVINRLFDGDSFGRVGLIFWLLAIIYNFSESSFFRLDVLWFTFLLLIVACPQTRRQAAWSRKFAEFKSV